jgi:hypothetical protein
VPFIAIRIPSRQKVLSIVTTPGRGSPAGPARVLDLAGQCGNWSRGENPLPCSFDGRKDLLPPLRVFCHYIGHFPAIKGTSKLLKSPILACQDIGFATPPAADASTARSTMTELAHVYHPDTGGSQEQMIRVNAAYEAACAGLEDS